MQTLLLMSSILFTCFSYAQTKKYLIYFTDKNNTPYSVNDPDAYLSQRAIDRRLKQGISINIRDIPVNKVYADSLSAIGANVWYTSKWFNAAVIEADSITLTTINDLGFVTGSEKIARKKKSTSSKNRKFEFEFKDSYEVPGNSTHFKFEKPKSKIVNLKSKIDYGPSLNQVAMIGADVMHTEGFRGEGMIIAILDAGFTNTDTLPVFDSLFANNQILGTYDFVSNDPSVYNDHWHGTAVLSTIGGYLKKQLIGTAYKANFFLFRTEDASSEFHIEEINWLIAAEYADSAGVDVINTSLGYTDFDDPSMNYTYADMDGNSALITRAADFAAATGMLIVISAGNLGNVSWKYISAPADGDSVLAVGAVDQNEVYASFSSQGPSFDGRVKPNLMTQGQNVWAATSTGGFANMNGTSLSSPILCGMAAGFWQAYPGLTNMEVIDFLQQSASFYDNPNDQYGYGIPDYSLAKELVCKTKGKPFVINLGNDTILCEGSSIHVDIDSINSNLSYLWNTGETTQTISVNKRGTYYISVKSDYCQRRDTIIVDFIKIDIVFPNPFSDESPISYYICPDNIGREVIVKIFDTCGKLIFTDKIINAKIINQLNINPKVLPPGIYLISVITQNTLYTTKVVKI